MRRVARLAVVAGLTAGLVGPSLAAATEVAEPERRLAAAVDPLAVDAAMRAFLAERVDRRQVRRGRLQDLMHALFDPEEGLGVVYGVSGTRTAAETFAVAEGNCLSFTLLFVALAREVGLETYFVEVGDVVGFSREGETIFGHWHVYAEVEVDEGQVIVDFLPVEERRYVARRRIGPARVRAHFHNNLGAEVLVTGDVDTALGHFRAALAADPAFSPARLNLGVAQRRRGDVAAAERTLRELLADEPRHAQAAKNLAALLVEAGRSEEARPWLARAERYLERNPFHHFQRATAALAADDPAAAREHLRQAIRRQPGEGLFHERLADVLFRLGETAAALESLERAMALAADPELSAALAARLAARRDGLEAGGG